MSSLTDRGATSSGTAGAEADDPREALCNEGLIGPARSIQVPAERITRLNGLMLDLDPKLLVPDNPVFPPADDPREFLERIGPALGRHPLLGHAEVRSSGRGLHAILRLDPPVDLATAADQQHWSTLVKVVQGSLPADPNAPGITALTRPVGSVNSRNGAVVEVLRPGRPVAPDRVEAFVRELAAAPFATVAKVLLGSERAEPCPICRKPGSSLGVLDRGGRCYTCGRVTLEMLYGVAYRPDGGEAGAPGEAEGGPAAPGHPEVASRRRSAS